MHRRSIAQNFRYPLPDFRRVVANADHGVGAQLRGVRQHLLKRILPGSLAKARINRNIAAKNGLNGRCEISNDGT